MAYETLRNLMGPFEGLPMGTVLTVAVCIAVTAAVVLLFSEKYRIANASAERRLARLERSNELLDGNGEYDIRDVVLASAKDVDAARRTVKAKRAASVVSIMACAVLALAILTGYAEWSTMSLARSHGYADGWDQSPASLWEDIEKSPVEDRLPRDMSGSILMYYKFGCEDCNELGEELYAALSSLAPTYRIATRSPTGRKLIEQYPVAEVPACVYFRHDGRQLYYILYEDGPDGTAVDQDAIRGLALGIAADVAASRGTDDTEERT